MTTFYLLALTLDWLVYLIFSLDWSVYLIFSFLYDIIYNVKHQLVTNIRRIRNISIYNTQHIHLVHNISLFDECPILKLVILSKNQIQYEIYDDLLRTQRQALSNIGTWKTFFRGGVYKWKKKVNCPTTDSLAFSWVPPKKNVIIFEAL